MSTDQNQMIEAARIIARELRYLGAGDSTDNHGALEAHGMLLKEAFAPLDGIDSQAIGSAIAEGLEALTDKVDDIARAILAVSASLDRLAHVMEDR